MQTEQIEVMVVAVVLGSASPSSLTLFRGVIVQPISLGTAGDWRIEAPGVAPVHGALCFDGSALHVWSDPEAGAPITVNGEVIPAQWTPVAFPAVMSFGEARIVVRGPRPKRSEVPRSDDTTRIVKRPSPPAPVLHIAPAPRPEADATRLVDIEALLPKIGVKAAPRVLPAAGRPASPVVRDAALVAPSPRSASSATADETALRRASFRPLSLWKQIPLPARISSALLLLGAGMLMLPALGHSTVLASPSERGAAAASASTGQKSVADAAAAASGSVAASASGSVTPSAVTPSAAPNPAPLGLARDTQAGALPALVDSAKPVTSAKRGPTLQRRAVDSLIAGNDVETTRLYEELVNGDPANATYREALRILNRRNR